MARESKHLTFEDRHTIYHGLGRKESFADIGRSIGKDATSVSREIRNHVQTSQKGRVGQSFNDCVHRYKCDVWGNCNKRACRRERCSSCYLGCGKGKCDRYEKDFCSRLSSPPYVCNACERKPVCSLEKKYYEPVLAHKEAQRVLRESRKGLAISESEAKYLDSVIYPMLKKGHSIYNICLEHRDEVPYAERTIYKYVHAGVFPKSRLVDLPRAVRYKPRKETRHKSLKVDKKCREGRTYADYLKYMEDHPDTPVVEMDSVIGCRDETPALLTTHFVQCSVQFAYWREHNDARSVAEIMDCLYDILGHDDFVKLFPVILADNGSEFSDPLSIEFINGIRRTRVFYCDPNRSDQKGACENNHEMIRRVIPKGTSLSQYDQNQIIVMMDHINSYRREKLGGRSPYEVFSFLYGNEVIDKLGIRLIPSQDINLTPELLS